MQKDITSVISLHYMGSVCLFLSIFLGHLYHISLIFSLASKELGEVHFACGTYFGQNLNTVGNCAHVHLRRYITGE